LKHICVALFCGGSFCGCDVSGTSNCRVCRNKWFGNPSIVVLQFPKYNIPKVFAPEFAAISTRETSISDRFGSSVLLRQFHGAKPV